MIEDKQAVVTATVVTSNQNHIVRAGEAFARAAAGLALEGISVSVYFGWPEED